MNKIKLKEDDIVLCTVSKIEGAVVFLDIENNGQGTMMMPEVAAGRIRNIRDYVSPGRKIVCKVLKVFPDHAELSLRRVTAKERDELLRRHEKKRTFLNVLKKVIKNPEKVIEEIEKELDLSEFMDKIKDKIKLLEKFMSKPEVEKLKKIFTSKKEKEKVVKKTIILKSVLETGLNDIKEVLDIKNAKIKYLGSSKFLIELTAGDFKEANNKINEIIKQIEKKAKEKKVQFELKEK